MEENSTALRGLVVPPPKSEGHRRRASSGATAAAANQNSTDNAALDDFQLLAMQSLKAVPSADDAKPTTQEEKPQKTFEPITIELPKSDPQSSGKSSPVNSPTTTAIKSRNRPSLISITASKNGPTKVIATEESETEGLAPNSTDVSPSVPALAPAPPVNIAKSLHVRKRPSQLNLDFPYEVPLPAKAQDVSPVSSATPMTPHSPYTPNILHPRSPSASRSPRTPHSPAANPDPAADRLRRLSTGVRHVAALDALPALHQGSEFLIHRNRKLTKMVVSGHLSEETTKDWIIVRLLEDNKTLEWEEQGVAPEFTRLSLAEVEQVTQWLSAEEKEALGPVCKATFTLICVDRIEKDTHNSVTKKAHRLTLIAKNEMVINIWTNGLRKLTEFIEQKADLTAVEDLIVDVPFNEEGPKNFEDMIQEHFSEKNRKASLAPPSPAPREVAPVLLTERRKSFSDEKNSRTIDVLPILKKGIDFFKYGRKGSPHFRHIWLEHDNSSLCWLSKFKNPKSTQVPLADVVGITLGQSTSVFARNNPPVALEPASFSVIYANKAKTLDLVALNTNVYNIWTLGLEKLVSLIRTSPYHEIKKLKELMIEVPISAAPKTFTAIIDEHY